MDFKAQRAKSAAIDSGAALAGAIAAHALTNFASEKVMASNPTSTIGKFIPLAVVAACIGVQAFGIVPAGNDMIQSALLGATVTSGMSAVRELSGANDDTKNTQGIAKIVSQYVPSLSGLGNAPVMYDYRESPMVLAQVGAEQRMLNQGTAWPAPAQATAQPVKLRQIG